MSIFANGAPNSPKNRFRQARAALFGQIVGDVIAGKGHCTILDIGGTVGYWQIFGGGIDWRQASLTVLNLDPQPDPSEPHIRCVVGDARRLDGFADYSFDVVHSNSVIEHVGLWESMQDMADEVRRVAPRYFVQTPSFWFPLEVHTRVPFFQFLPEPLRLAMMLKWRLGYMPRAADIGEASRMLHGTMLLTKSQMRFLFPDGEIVTERALGFPKSYIAIRR